MPKRTGLIVYPGFQALDLIALSVFEFANALAGKPLYEFALLSLEGGMVPSSTGIRVETQAIGFGVYDTLMVAGVLGIPSVPAALIDKLGELRPATRRLASICTGAFVLAEAGLLDGLRATTHWAWGRRLQEAFPKVLLDEDKIFVRDGAIWTSAGATACIDLALALVEDDLGAESAKAVARGMVVYHRRTGGQSQFSALTELQPSSDRVRDALRFARDNLHRDLSVEELADHVAWSPRHFTRVFQTQTGMGPAKAIEKLRVEAAQSLIEQGHASVARIAERTGFGDEERMRRAFLRAFGQSPKAMMQQARTRQQHVYLG